MLPCRSPVDMSQPTDDTEPIERADTHAASKISPWFRITDRRTIATPQSRAQLGLDHWPDGTIGFTRHRRRTLAFAPNGPVTAVHSSRSAKLPGRITNRRLSIDGLAADVDHASGGPVYRDDSGGLLLFYHGERHADGDAERYDSFIGLAASADGGNSFADLGPIVSPEVRLVNGTPVSGAEIGPGPFLIAGDHLLVYGCDTRAEQHFQNLWVARCPLDEVVESSRRGSPGTWTKLLDGDWTSPGLGGKATDLLATPRNSCWFDVTYLAAAEAFLLVVSPIWPSLLSPRCRQSSDSEAGHRTSGTTRHISRPTGSSGRIWAISSTRHSPARPSM